jgi:hypothetical protein
MNVSLNALAPRRVHGKMSRKRLCDLVDVFVQLHCLGLVRATRPHPEHSMLLVIDAKHVVADADHIGDETKRSLRPGELTCNHHGGVLQRFWFNLHGSLYSRWNRMLNLYPACLYT